MKFPTITQVSLLALTLGFVVHAQATDEHSMTGCLKQGSEAGSYLLTDLGTGAGPKEVLIASSTVDLAGHVGHKVELTGSTVAVKDPDAHVMAITAMKHLAASCP